jgi:uncharacterized sodium:solute symporter family permease YidK
MSAKAEPIHKWDRAVALKAFLFGAVLEAVAIAPAVISPWGHAGPESLFGWLSLLVNLPGLYLCRLMGVGRFAGESVVALILTVYLIQTMVISYVAFVWLRWRKRALSS